MIDTSNLIERLRKLHDPMTACVEAAAIIEDLEARLRIETKRADDAEARNDFLMTELDKLIEKARQS